MSLLLYTNLTVFRLCFQLFVVAATVINWDFSQILNGPEAAWVGDYFYLNLAVCYYGLLEPG